MKLLAEKQALEKLRELKSAYQKQIRDVYEPRAKSCLTCATKGACCVDAHFVNVHITRLEAVQIKKTLAKLGEPRQHEIYKRVAETVEKYDLTAAADTFAKTFACPLFEKEIGCLVHAEGKPAPCIQHACYENKADLPPDELQEKAENAIERLNRQTYGQNPSWLPLPIWLDLTKP